MNTQICQDLKILRIEDRNIEELSIRDIISSYRKLVKKLHPDTSGYDSKEDFQELGNAYERMLKVVVDKTQKKEEEYEKRRSEESEEMSFNEDYEEKFVKENFHNFNFPTEKEGSFVVKVENEHAESWDKCFQNLYGEAKVNTNAKTGVEVSRLWKISYEGVELTIHLYKKPKTTKVSKFLVQGGNHVAKYLFVFTELPIIYKKVCEMEPEKSLPDAKRFKNISGVTCDQCKFSSSSMIQMKKHMNTIHNPKRRTGFKRLSNFTPITKPLKKAKKIEALRPNLFLNAEGIADESLLMLEDTFRGNENQCTLEEKDTIITSNDVVEHELYSCTVCEFDTEDANQMKMHEMKHRDNQCSCTFGATDVTVLKDHDSACITLKENNEEKETMIAPTVVEDKVPKLPINLQETVVICGSCENSFSTMDCFNKHMEKCHVEVESFECEICKFKTQTRDDLENHKILQHGRIAEFEAVNNEDLTQHRQEHSEKRNIKCNQCDSQYQDTKSFITHLLNEHSNNSEVIQCPHCDYRSLDIGSLDFHIENDHVELALLGHISENQTMLSKNFETFKTELTPLLNKFIDGHNAMKQELFIMRQNYSSTNEKLGKMENMMNNLIDLFSNKAPEEEEHIENIKA